MSNGPPGAAGRVLVMGRIELSKNVIAKTDRRSSPRGLSRSGCVASTDMITSEVIIGRSMSEGVALFREVLPAIVACS